jgi:hypothetical protein
MNRGNGGRFYAVGKHGHGVVLVFFDPLKVFIISHKEVEAFASASDPKLSNADVYDQIMRACGCVTCEYDSKNPTEEISTRELGYMDNLVRMGVKMSNTDFAITGDVDLSTHQEVQTRRRSAIIIHEAIDKVLRDKSSSSAPEFLKLLTEADVQE